jgi:NAD(P)-dependent dehydrogenase (short-subunit alcohol dehydrogenase family)
MTDCAPASRWALVTGASSGIGRATVHRLARAGYDVIGMGRDAKRLEETRKGLPSDASYEPVACDLSIPKDIATTVARIERFLLERGGNLNCLVNNAGIFEQVAFKDSTDANWESQFQTNLMGPVRLTRSLYKELCKSQGASVINISSTLGLRPVPMSSAYAAVKAAMVAWTKSLALEWASDKITVNCVCPGIVNTPIHNSRSHVDGSEISTEMMKQMDRLHPVGRMGRPDEVAETILYLAQSPWSTGAIISIDGGISL